MPDLMKGVALALAFGLLATPVSAATLTKDGNEVVVRGTMNWTQGLPDDNPVPRAQTDYEFRLPFAGSPFDPNFVRPGIFPPDFTQIENNSRVSVGSPSRADVQDTGRFEDFGNPGFMLVVDSTGTTIDFRDREGQGLNPQPIVSAQHVSLQHLDVTFDQANGLSGDREYEFFINFDQDFRTVTSIAAIMTERFLTRSVNPTDPDQEVFVFVPTGYTGFSPLETPIDVATVPLPAAAPLLASGLALLGYARYRRAKKQAA